MSYDNSANSMRRLEERFERLQLDIGDLKAAIGRLQQPSANSGGGQQTSSGNNALYFATNAAAVSAASGTTMTGLTASTFTSTVYSTGSTTLTAFATSQTIYWWYLDGLPISSIVPVEPNAAGTGWDAIGGGCTPL